MAGQGVTLPMIIALITCPALLGTSEAIRQGQQKDRKEEHRARRCNLIVRCLKPSRKSREIDHRYVVLRDSKLYINTGLEDDETSFGHPFMGYYLPYPDSKYEGLVSSIADNPPVMNWIYVDRDTYEIKYGIRKDAQPNITGPFDCTRQEHRLTLDGWEGFVAVEDENGLWALYFDFDDDGLKSKIGLDRMVLEIELIRTERKIKREVKLRKEVL
ncbi:hypothetical protein F5884DRAFT_779497 [Xylogone sp. PMI_703]|nr:hypothetical protein F5884DRAFT_779497 [Xylogone sp. PMI_703]